MVSDTETAEASSSSDPQTIILHVLSPSADAPNRITLNDLPLTTSVLQLKERLSDEISSRPRPEMQRLIYRGKPLVNNADTLRNILGEIDVCSMTIISTILSSGANTIFPYAVSCILNASGSTS